MSAVLTTPVAAPGATDDDAAPGAAIDRLRRAWEDLRPLGLLAPAGHDTRAELDALRAVAREDLGLARVLDGHRNALDRLLGPLRNDVPPAEREAARAGRHALGVWGADPAPDGREGAPALLHDGPDGPVVSGVKTFCSGAGHVARALILVRTAPDGPPSTLVLVDLTVPGTVEVDDGWFAAPALATSLSHRVLLSGAPVLAVLGAPGALGAEPWFSGDALRTTATWVGALEHVVDGVLADVTLRSPGDAEAAELATLRRAADGAALWLRHASEAVSAARAEPSGAALVAEAARRVRLARLEVAERAGHALELAARLGGSRPLVATGGWAGARADLDLLLRQHRLHGVAVRAGRDALEVDG